MTTFKVDRDANVNGTSLKGYVTASYTKLVELFGAPHCADSSGEDKTQLEWLFSDDQGNSFTLYDWKNYGIDVTQLKSLQFHIGGKGSAMDFIEWLETKLNGKG